MDEPTDVAKDEVEGGRKRNPVVAFLLSPLDGTNPAPMRLVGDWICVAGIALFCVSAFALPWLTVGVKDVLGIGKALGVRAPSESYKLSVSPWALWLMAALLVVIVLGLWFVQTKGGIVIGAGVACLIFNVVFFIGVWKKVNGIIGDVVGLARSIPFIGDVLGAALSQIAKSMLSVHVATGYWLFVPAGLLLIAGGSLRLASRGSRTAGA
jgi:hypothetical protein